MGTHGSPAAGRTQDAVARGKLWMAAAAGMPWVAAAVVRAGCGGLRVSGVTGRGMMKGNNCLQHAFKG